MLVRLGTTVLNNGWRKDLAKGDYQIAVKFLQAKFRNIYETTDNHMLAGWSHIRLPNLIPNVSMDVLDLALKSEELRLYKGGLRGHLISYSHHNSYKCSNINMGNSNYIIDYCEKVIKVTEFMGIRAIHLCNHVNFEDFRGAVETIRYIKDNTRLKVFNSICIENSEYGMGLKECIELASCTGVPVIYDNLHHRINGSGGSLQKLIKATTNTWTGTLPIKMHYSNGNKLGEHNSELDIMEFKNILNKYKKFTKELVVMVELRQSKEIIENLKYGSDFQWYRDLTFNY